MNGSVFFRLSYLDYSDLQLFVIFIFEVDFSVTYFMTSAENSVWEPPNPVEEDTPTHHMHRGQTSKSLFLFFIAGISFTS